jgi:hypothetical protein
VLHNHRSWKCVVQRSLASKNLRGRRVCISSWESNCCRRRPWKRCGIIIHIHHQCKDPCTHPYTAVRYRSTKSQHPSRLATVSWARHRSDLDLRSTTRRFEQDRRIAKSFGRSRNEGYRRPEKFSGAFIEHLEMRAPFIVLESPLVSFVETSAP